jgi:hypothetical protein
MWWRLTKMTRTSNPTASKETIRKWMDSSYLYTEIMDGDDYHYWCGFLDALKSVIGDAPGLD